MFAVSDRISVLGFLGTVRYVGPLHVWCNDTLAYGIEWDDPERGKNSGDVDRVPYFTTSVPGNGSFLKASSKNIEKPCLFFEAVHDKYSSDANSEFLLEKVVLGTKTIECYGFQKLNEILNNIAVLKVIMVDHRRISDAGNPEKWFPNTSFDKIKFRAHTLDLSYNLLAEWSETSEILRHFPELKSLSLTGNRMNRDESLLLLPEKVTHLSFCDTDILPKTLMSLSLQHITKLELAGNHYQDSSFTNWSAPLNLQYLDLSFNCLERVPAVFSIQNLTHLILADNNIASIEDLPVFRNLQVLDLRRNPISSHEEIDLIPVKFPNLTELRINDCPVFGSVSPDEMAFNLIGRLQCEPWKGPKSRAIIKLNGSYLLDLEITNAELYFISKVKSGIWKISNGDRWHDLLDKYKISEKPSTFKIVNDRKICLSIRRYSDPNTEHFSRVFLQNNTVLRLKGVIAKHINTFILDFSVFYYVNDDDASYESRQVMNDDIASLQSLGLAQNHRIYIQ